MARTPICGEHTLPQLLQPGGFSQTISAILRPSYHLQMKNWSWGRLNNFWVHKGHGEWRTPWLTEVLSWYVCFWHGHSNAKQPSFRPMGNWQSLPCCEAQRDGSFCWVCRCWWYMHNILVPDVDSLTTVPLVKTAPMRLVKLWDLSSCIPQTCLHITDRCSVVYLYLITTCRDGAQRYKYHP